MLLGVNIDHIASLREARKINDPDPLDAVSIAKRAGAYQITIHLREDRRHINDDDAARIIQNSHLPVNLECSLDSEILDIVCKLKPFRATLVPEKREEVTTEGGLDVERFSEKTKAAIERLKENDIYTSLFIDADRATIERSKELGADMIELHTGSYANAHLMLYSNLTRTNRSIKELEMSRESLREKIEEEIARIRDCSILSRELGVDVAAGHGLNYQNVQEIAKIHEIEELNIGQSIVARAVYVGLEQAIKDMFELMH